MKKIFVKATEEYCSYENHVSAPLLRRAFTLTAAPVSAKLLICGLGFYELYVNGKNITKGHIAPYISNPDDICCYDSYDVTNLLTEGENVIGIMLGNGFANAFGGAAWDFEKADFRAAPSCAVELSVKTEENELLIDASCGFKCHPSPIRFDDLRLGEVYDAREELSGWATAGFDDSDWTDAIHAETPRGLLKECDADPILVFEERKPISVTRSGDGYLYDFGVNSSGVCKLKINAKPGQRISMMHGELLVDGRLNNDYISFSKKRYPYYNDFNQTAIYIAKGEGTEEYTPSFTYFGFRYVYVEGIDEEQATEELLTYLVMHSALKEIGGFSCSDEKVNTLYEMAKNSDLSNFFYFPTDCPHREKNGWTGDASLSADHTSLIFDTERSYRAWLHQIRLSQNSEGALPGIVPTAGWGFAWGNGPTWDSVLFNLPYVLFKLRGCTDVIKENAHAMMRYLEYVIKQRDEKGLVAIGLGDWVPVGKPAEAYDAPLSLTDSVMVMDVSKKAAEMFRAVGYTHQADFAASISRDMREAIRRELVDFETMTVKGSCQSSQCIALYYGVFDDNERKLATEVLVDLIHKNNDRFDCGFIGMHCIFHALSDFGYDELAYKMIMAKGYPSYAHLIDIGETSLVEMFMPNPVDAASHNHHFQGDIARWFTRAIAGLTVIDDKTVRIEECKIASINSASAWYELPLGKVSVEWKRDGERINLKYSAPNGVTVIT